jgi:hypothetical protein
MASSTAKPTLWQWVSRFPQATFPFLLSPSFSFCLFIFSLYLQPVPVKIWVALKGAITFSLFLHVRDTNFRPMAWLGFTPFPIDYLVHSLSSLVVILLSFVT